MGEYYITIEIRRNNNIHDKLHNSRDFFFNLAFRNSSHYIIFKFPGTKGCANIKRNKAIILDKYVYLYIICLISKIIHYSHF